MLSIRIVVLAAALLASLPAHAVDSRNGGAVAVVPVAESAAVEKCAHGVKQSICARCNPKLEAVFKAKGDWCAEHTRPESQCVICHPELGKQDIK